MTTKEFAKGWKHFCSCIDFGNSNLDAEAIQFMNEALGKIATQHDALLDELNKSTALLEAVHESIELSKGAKLSIHNKIIENKAAIALTKGE